jgi:hypothetical protein
VSSESYLLDSTMTSKQQQAVPGVREGWFTETEVMWPGQTFSLALEVCILLYYLYFCFSIFVDGMVSYPSLFVAVVAAPAAAGILRAKVGFVS